MPTSLTCYGGVAEIGGNKILLEDARGRLFFDFGKAIGRYHRYFDGVFLNARPQRGLLDWLALELLPPLPGLLRDDLIPAFDPADLSITEIPPSGRQRKARTHVELSDAAREAFWDHWQTQFPQVYRDLRREAGRPAVDMILLSHAHLDHIGDMAYVSPEVPVSSSRMTAFISKVLLDTGPNGQSGAPFLRLRAPTPDGLLHADGAHREYALRPWHFLDGAPEGRPSADPLDNALAFWAMPAAKAPEPMPPPPSPVRLIEHWPVDHSLLGGVGYVVETEAGWVAYSGDIRFHGRDGYRTRAFAERLAELRPAALLCEGTHLHGPTKTTEAEVRDNCLRAVQHARGQLIIADFAPRNVERLLTFVDIAEVTGRCLLVQPKDAYLLRGMSLADPKALPDVMQSPHVCLYADPKTKPAAWEQHIRARYAGHTVTPAHVQKNPGEFILAFSLLDMADLLDLEYLQRRAPGGIYIFSNSPAYDDEQNVDLVRLWHWTQRLGLKLIGLRPVTGPRGEVTRIESDPGYHASGHAGGDELVDFVKTARPHTLIPIHTTIPETWTTLLAGSGISVTLPEYGKPIMIRD